MAIWVSEAQFRDRFFEALGELPNPGYFHFVTGPGRSGAIAAVYASHHLGIPFLPYGAEPPMHREVLIVDTAVQSGRTLRKACRKYATSHCIYAFNEPPRVKFWYEKKHDRKEI